MENQIENQGLSQNLNQNPAPPENMRTKKKVWIAAIAVAILILLIGGYFVWANYLSPGAQQRRELQKNIDKYTSAMNTLEEAMRNDTYGGKTPEETLAMFIDALKKGDVSLASKYFILDTNTRSPDYLTRRKWEEALNGPNPQLNLGEIVDKLLKAVPDTKNISTQSDYKFAVYKDSGSLDIYINMELNKYSQVWKIESM